MTYTVLNLYLQLPITNAEVLNKGSLETLGLLSFNLLQK